MPFCIALIALGAVALVFYLLEKCRRYSVRGVLMKGTVSLLFIAVAATAASQNPNHVMNGWVIVGLALGLLGDIWLDLKFVYPKDEKLYTYSGFFVFGVGHILYVVGMMSEFYSDGNWLFFLIPLGGSLLFACANHLLSKPMGLNFGKMKFIVFGYAFLLAMTTATALLCCIHTGWGKPAAIMMLAGGISFAVSDLVLSGTYFGEGKERPIDFILNYLTYYGAQFTIAFSLLFL